LQSRAHVKVDFYTLDTDWSGWVAGLIYIMMCHVLVVWYFQTSDNAISCANLGVGTD